jgi:hypothetical protein
MSEGAELPRREAVEKTIPGASESKKRDCGLLIETPGFDRKWGFFNVRCSLQ